VAGPKRPEQKWGRCFEQINRTRGTVVCERLECADRLAAQSRGLIGRESLDAADGMLFINGRLMPFIWMHMFFMKFANDIVFLGRDDRVVKVDRELKPWRVSSIVFGAREAIELPAAAAKFCRLEIGDLLQVEPVGKNAPD
jgi:uncharacterized protein